MVSPELLNTLQGLNRANKLYIAQILISDLAQQETALIQTGQSYPIWSPYDAFAAANTMLEVLQSTIV
ncbi:MAG: hypothetical protein HC916_22040 [Coleofasciculaceae cyanobacterium SM2_1_6]|nr:hypothetical protein [Coleofasciculaceae cyanobacterium SM2_1_6]